MTEQTGVPDHRCGFELEEAIGRRGRRDKIGCCWRVTWRDTDRCIWHAEVENKPIEELKAARVDGPERLDGAYLVGVDADFHGSANDNLSFRGCELGYTNFSNGEFGWTDFYNAELSDAQFHDANLHRATFTCANLSHAEFHNTNLQGASFDAASLYNAQFHDADLLSAIFRGADVISAKFHNADLSCACFEDAKLKGAQFNNADLRDAHFNRATLSGGDCTDADARMADFSHALLHSTLFTRTDCREATFTDAFLYQAVFSDTRIDSQTIFYEPEIASNTSRPTVVYEDYDLIDSQPVILREESRFPEVTPSEGIPWAKLPEETHPLEAAEWVYRRLEKLHEENALSEDTRQYHVNKEEARRKYQRESGESARFVVSTFLWYVTGHGESISRLFASAAVLIVSCGILYPLAGGFESSSTGTVHQIPLTELHQVISPDGATTLLQGIYFSIITFTTIGYGDLYPTGVGSKVLVGFESLSGAILVALFVFILGRRIAR